MEKEAKYHHNKRSLELTGRSHVVFGHRLEAGDVIQPDDVYDSTSGKWEKPPISGIPLGEGNATVWVRPAKE